MRQMRIIHNGEMSPVSLRSYKRDVLGNVFTCAINLVRAVHTSEIPWASTKSEEAAGVLEALTPANWGLEGSDCLYPHIPPTHAYLISLIWQDEVAQKCWQRANEFNLPESTAYYLSSITRLSKEPFIPSQEDVLRLRLPTSETTVNDFANDGWTFRITDIGGQRGSRRRWVRIFDGINAIIFLAALSEYDQVWHIEDEEEEGKNRLELSLEIFQEVIRYPGFERTSVIVFLNKTDVLEQRILTSDLQKYFPDYTGPKQDARRATEYIQERFKSIARRENKNVHFHETCATDTQKTKFVFTAVRDDILWRNVKEIVEPFSVME
ncbi:UNVERIFIED_CONTAM: hypothetical protein GTU68_015506 [Idotea baltica]|nr:hypothetical protein [Idotea baltica]